MTHDSGVNDALRCDETSGLHVMYQVCRVFCFFFGFFLSHIENVSTLERGESIYT